jgi:metal-responsive CopG/Arc/MetJ family transcriptional regulator
MNGETLDLESVTVEFDEEVIETIDRKAFADHRDNREAAVRDLVDEWLKSHDRSGETE